VEALKASHADKKEYHEEQIARLEVELKRLRGRMDAIYEDKLDGRIGEDFWERKRREYQARQAEIMRSLEQHQKANTFYFDAGVRVLRLAQKAYDLWLAQPQTEKRKLLDVLLPNCTFDGENLDATYRKPFCWLTEGSLRSVWRAIRNDFANWLQAEECREVACHAL
jgi:site-specific DNA recombinase